MEIMDVANIPMNHKGNLSLCISKKQPGVMFGKSKMISICNDAEETQVVVLQCEPEGELLFELFSNSDSDMATKCPTSFGTASISLTDLLKAVSRLTIPRMLEFGSGTDPVMLSVAISTTPPSSVPSYAVRKGDKEACAKGIDGISGVVASADCTAKCQSGGGMSIYQSGVLAFYGSCAGKCHILDGARCLTIDGIASYGAKCRSVEGVATYGAKCRSVDAGAACGAKCHSVDGGAIHGAKCRSVDGGATCGAKCHGGT